MTNNAYLNELTKEMDRAMFPVIPLGKVFTEHAKSLSCALCDSLKEFIIQLDGHYYLLHPGPNTGRYQYARLGDSSVFNYQVNIEAVHLFDLDPTAFLENLRKRLPGVSLSFGTEQNRVLDFYFRESLETTVDDLLINAPCKVTK